MFTLRAPRRGQASQPASPASPAQSAKPGLAMPGISQITALSQTLLVLCYWRRCDARLENFDVKMFLM